MLSVIIATDNCEEALAHTLGTLVPAAADGTVREVIVVDAGSTDQTALIAEGTGCRLVVRQGDLGRRLSAGAEAASRGDWLMFLAPGVLLQAGWEDDVLALLERLQRRGQRDRAAAFRYALDDTGLSARIREAATRFSHRLGGVLHADQPLLIAADFYARLGGHAALGTLAVADLSRRIGSRRLIHLRRPAYRMPPQSETESHGRGVFRALLLTLRLPVGWVARLAG